ncbi:unnamed protein product [Lymnaea stagnalis]|uniref:VWF/SSPO/Zonadhesin-like cysteine-rich domain-containing protein n=1 Tax=Lymnaea stagnalis TaxID=6523 RepID=A0AAV2IP82_LYMST
MPLCTEVQDMDPCLLKGFMSRKNATMKCIKLKSNGFRRCHREVPPESFFTSCIHDLCTCQEDSKCLCSILEAYARECAKSGVKVAWRSSNFCDFECDSSKGLEFDECGSPCPRTCANIQTSGHNLKCLKPCVPSCQCPSGKVLHNGKCIFPSSCPHIEMIPVL